MAVGQVPVIAGTGANATAEAIYLTLHAQKAGAPPSRTRIPKKSSCPSPRAGGSGHGVTPNVVDAGTRMSNQ